jgi:hypothetical protein
VNIWTKACDLKQGQTISMYEKDWVIDAIDWHNGIVEVWVVDRPGSFIFVPLKQVLLKVGN